MARAKQQGTSGSGEVFVEGQIVKGMGRECGGPLANTVELSGEIIGFTGGNHQYCTIRTPSGYTHTIDTRTLKKG